MAEPAVVVGMVGGEVFGAAAHRALAEADVILGASRHLARLTPRPEVECVELRGALPPLIELVAARQAAGRRVCVLSSGDPGFFGITRLLAARLGDAVRVLPAPSSVSLAWAAAGMSWDDADVVSAHGRALEAAIPRALRSPKVAILTAPSAPPQAIGAALIGAGCGPRDVIVASRLGEADEQVVRTDLPGLAAGSFDPMSVVLLVAPTVGDGTPSISWGRAESGFARRGGMITKSEVRAVVLGMLALPRAGVLWDVGAGSGSVGVEAATVAPGLRVYAVERVEADAGNIRQNARDAGVAVDVVTGSAPEVLGDLPVPDRVFVGGGGPEVVEACWQRLQPGGRLVATFAVLEHAVAARRLLGEMIQVRIDRAVPIGAAGVRLEPLNPVFVCWGDRPVAAPPEVGDGAPRDRRSADTGRAELAELVVGVGMASAATAAEVEALVDAALMFIGAGRADVVAFATRESFAGDPRLPAGAPVEFVADAELIAASAPTERATGIPAQVAATAAQLVAGRRWGATAMLVPTQRSAHVTVAVCGKDQA